MGRIHAAAPVALEHHDFVPGRQQQQRRRQPRDAAAEDDDVDVPIAIELWKRFDCLERGPIGHWHASPFGKGETGRL